MRKTIAQPSQIPARPMWIVTVLAIDAMAENLIVGAVPSQFHRNHLDVEAWSVPTTVRKTEVQT